MIEMFGNPVFKGIEIASAFVHQETELKIKKTMILTDEIEHEMERFRFVSEKALSEIDGLKENAIRKGDKDEIEIFDAHLMMAQDPMLIDKITERIQVELYSLEQAIEVTKAEIVAIFASIDDEYLKARVADYEDIANRFLRIALGIENKSFEDINEEVILVAKDLKPSETAGFTSYIKGILLEEGSQTSHAAIMAKAKGIPAVVGLSGVMDQVKSGDKIILDSIDNKVFILPDAEMINKYKSLKDRLNFRKAKLEELKDTEAVTKDGRKIKLYGNIGSSKEVGYVKENGGTGVGLFRTEFIYMDASSFPTEEQQFSEYKRAVEIGLEDVIVRTLDIGGDKNLPYFEFNKEENPFLGFRALRFTLANEELFKTQLRAILRASAFGKTSIMFPMVSSLEEVQRAKALLEICKQELADQGKDFDKEIKVGIMIEIPAAVAIADILIEEVDFFSIGTNDLCQYTLAVDRMNKEVAYLYQPLHPAILRQIRQTVNAARPSGKDVGVCGEMAGDTANALVLIGLGVNELSMSPAVIPEVKELIRNITFEEACLLADKALECKTAEAVKNMLKQEAVHYDYQ